MDGIDGERARRIAELARLDLDDAELRRLAGELEEILGHFAELSDVDPEDGEPPVLGDLSPRMRADVPGPDPLARGPGEIAPDWREGFFVVPRLSAMSSGDEGEP